MEPGTPAEMAEFRALSAKVANQTATDEEIERWRDMRARFVQNPTAPAGLAPPNRPRAHARVSKKVRVLVQPLKRMHVTFTDEISAGGLRLMVREHMEEGTLMVVRMELGGQESSDAITATARVAWCRREGGHYQIGIEFLGLEWDEQERIDAYAHSFSVPPTEPGR